MFYELWDVRSGNIINTYDTEGEALAVVRDLVAANGPEYAHGLSLAIEDDAQDTTLVAKGTELAQRARSAGMSPSGGESSPPRPSVGRAAPGRP